MARLFADENIPLEVVEWLRQFGHDVLTARETGRANQRITDEDVLTFATSEQRVVVTINRRDFIRLHALREDHAGIIVCTQDVDFRGLAERVDAILKSVSTYNGMLFRVVRPR